MKGYFAKRNTEAKKKLKEFKVLDVNKYKVFTDIILLISKL